MTMKLLTIAALLVAPVLASVEVDPTEQISGTVHVSLNALDPAATLRWLGIVTPPATSQIGVMVCVRSDDPLANSFDITLIYLVGDNIRSKHSVVQRQYNPNSDWSNENFWLGVDPFNILSINIRESHEETFQYQHLVR